MTAAGVSQTPTVGMAVARTLLSDETAGSNTPSINLTRLLQKSITLSGGTLTPAAVIRMHRALTVTVQTQSLLLPVQFRILRRLRGGVDVGTLTDGTALLLTRQAQATFAVQSETSMPALTVAHVVLLAILATSTTSLGAFAITQQVVEIVELRFKASPPTVRFRSD
jgi:hypothetical protein